MAKMMEGRKLQSVEITVYDNFLTHKKLDILSKSLNGSNATVFQFCNDAGAFDLLSNEYTNFLKNT